MPVECSCPSTYMHVSISRLTGTFSHPSSVEDISRRPQPGVISTDTRTYLKCCQVAESASGDFTHEVPETKNPATTIPVFPT